MSEKITVAVIGLGQRGMGLINGVLIGMQNDENILITSVCDVYEDRVKDAADKIEKDTGARPAEYTDYREAIAAKPDTVVIAAAWELHVPIAVAAMESGIAVALEVGGAYCIEDCWRLVDTYEKTGTPFMFLENCCYGERELMVLNLVRKGLMGKISHCAGGYMHDLRSEITGGNENRHYRLRNYTYRNCENYPTHEIGPIAKVLNINNGNRFLTLSSTASCANGLRDYILENKPDDADLCGRKYNQGDVVTTVLKCANGETVTITLDTTLPRTYSRGFTVRGTKMSYFEDMDMLYIDGAPGNSEFNPKQLWGNAEKLKEKYQHPLWSGFEHKDDHGGIDYLVLKAFFNSFENNEPMPIDVYDAAVWMSITALSEQSIALGGMPVAVPDFTRGKWTYRSDLCEGTFGL